MSDFGYILIFWFAGIAAGLFVGVLCELYEQRYTAKQIMKKRLNLLRNLSDKKSYEEFRDKTG